MRGVVLSPADLSGELDWPGLAHDAGLTTIATHSGPEDVIPFLQSGKGRRFLDSCKRYGLEVEHELHAMHYLLPRNLFAEKPELFRMGEDGIRKPDFNCCATNPEALSIIADNAVAAAKICRSTTGRYFYWLDDSGDVCHCPLCSEFNAADQALIIENAILAELRDKVDPHAALAHLAYGKTMTLPEKIIPAEGIFLEYADMERDRTSGLGEQSENLARALLRIFPAGTAQVLEYWLDVSFFSHWKKPRVKLPWDDHIFRRDVEAYTNLGFSQFTTFAVGIDDEYVGAFGNAAEIKAYGDGLSSVLQSGK